MIYLETITLGCDSDEIAEVGNSYLVRIDGYTQHGYASLLSLIHSAFHYADLLPRETDYQAPVKVVVLLQSLAKKKEDDPETGYDRIKWLFQNAAPPRSGMIVSFYRAPLIRTVPTQYSLKYIWPFKEKWRGDGDYITFQKIEPKILPKLGGKNHGTESLDVQNKLIPFLESEGLNIKFVDYTLPIEELYRTLISSKAHFTYPGSSYTIAVALGMPVVAYGERAKRLPPHQVKNLIDIDLKLIQTHNPLPYGRSAGSAPLHMLYHDYDETEGKVYGVAGYPNNVTNLGNAALEAIGYAIEFLDEIDA
jgi:hypothetical protein